MTDVVGKFVVKEDRRIRALLRRLPADSTTELKAAISESGQALQYAMLTRVPVRTGKLASLIGLKTAKDGLATYVGFSKREFPRQWRAKPFGGAMAHFIEFGTKGTTGGGRTSKKTGRPLRAHAATPAHPFIFPALIEQGPHIIELHKKALQAALEKASQGEGSG